MLGPASGSILPRTAPVSPKTQTSSHISMTVQRPSGTAGYLWMEEDLRPQETLIAHVDGELLLADGVDPCVLLNPLGPIRVILVEFFY